MDWVETTGKSVEAALAYALDELGVDEQDAEVLVVEDARSGFLGIGRSDARIRARVRPAAPRPKRPQRNRRERSSSRGASTERADGAVPAGETASNPQTSRRRSSKGTVVPGALARAVGAPNSADHADNQAVGGTGTSARGRRRDQGRARSDTDVIARKTANVGDEEKQMSVDQQAEMAGTFVRGVVERFMLEAVTTVEVTEDHVSVAVTGEDLGLLVGPRGATLDALQELTRTVVQRRGEEHGTRILVDVAGFRARRVAALEAFARRVAEAVLASGAPEALEPMTAADRKVVHDAANAIDGVETTSEGTDPRRYVVVRPTAATAGALDSDTADIDETDETDPTVASPD